MVCSPVSARVGFGQTNVVCRFSIGASSFQRPASLSPFPGLRGWKLGKTMPLANANTTDANLLFERFIVGFFDALFSKIGLETFAY